MGLARQRVRRLVEVERVQLRLLAEHFSACAGRAGPAQLAELVLQLCSRHLADGVGGSPQRPVSRGRREICHDLLIILGSHAEILLVAFTVAGMPWLWRRRSRPRLRCFLAVPTSMSRISAVSASVYPPK